MAGEGGADDLTGAWKAFGRDNPAGKALFKLYNKDATKQVGNTFHARNKQLHDKKVATGWSPPPVTEPPKPKFERPQVEVPKFPKRIDYDTARVHYIPRRRPLEVIRAEIDAEYERMRCAPQPPPSRPLLDEREKSRLAELMRFRGKMPEVTPEQQAAAAKHVPKKSQKQQLEEIFAAIVQANRPPLAQPYLARAPVVLRRTALYGPQEIDERRQFLRDLESAGRLKLETVHTVRAEIQQRVTELQRVDQLLAACEQ